MQSQIRNSPVILYLASAATSMLGNAVAAIVWPWLVLERTGSASAAGFVAAAIALPSLVFAYFGGNLIDSLGRKPVSIVSDIISGLSTALVIVVDATVGLNIPLFIAIGILGAVGDIPGMAARAALVGDVSASSGRSVEAISGINQAIMGFSFLLGPALAGFLLAWLPLDAVLIITAACSLIAAAITGFIKLIPHPQTAEDDAETDLHKGLAGWKLAFSYPIIRLLGLTAFLSMVLVTPYLSVLMPARFQSSGEPHLLGLSMSAFAIGMMAASLIAAKVAKKQRLTWILAMSLYTISFIFMGWIDSAWSVMIGLFIAGIGSGLFNPLQMVLVTNSVPDHIRGRSFSVFSAINQLAGPIGLAITGMILSFTTIQVVAAALAIIYTAMSIVLVIWGLKLLPIREAAPVDEQE